jgi:hypothetical protein
MKHLIAIIVLLAIAAPVRAQLPSGFEPVEKNLIEKQKLEDAMTRDMQKQQAEPQRQEAKKSSNWWKWALGIAIVGGAAAAASGGGGGDSGNNGNNGTIRVGW